MGLFYNPSVFLPKDRKTPPFTQGRRWDLFLGEERFFRGAVKGLREWCRMAFSSSHKAYTHTSCGEKMTNWCKEVYPSMGYTSFDNFAYE